MKISFDEVWNDILAYARAHQEIETLVRTNVVAVLDACDEKIIVQSKKKVKEKEKPRIITKKDFRYVWDYLESKRTLELRDIEPELAGKRSIIFTLLAKACSPYISSS